VLSDLAVTKRCTQCKEQVQVERDRRDLQDYAIKYFNDPEETAVATCEEFADDFVSEYTSFKGEKGEVAQLPTPIFSSPPCAAGSWKHGHT
jgi:hypothetical protein